MTVWPVNKFWELFLLGSKPHGTNEPSFDFEIGQVRFLVLILDLSVTTYSALAEIHVGWWSIIVSDKRSKTQIDKV